MRARSPVSKKFLTALRPLEATHSITLASEHYRRGFFGGGATAVHILVDDVVIECSTRDPASELPVEVRCKNSVALEYVPHLYAYFERTTNYEGIADSMEQVHWLAKRFDAVADLLCGSDVEQLRQYQAFAQSLRDAESQVQIARFRKEMKSEK
jgi:hypothetical protein